MIKKVMAYQLRRWCKSTMRQTAK